MSESTANKEKFHIITDSSCDLPLELLDERNITMVPFYVSFDDVHYEKEAVEISVRDFYQRMVDNPNVYPKSSLPSVQDYIDVFRTYAESGVPVICICITTKFSGSYQSAMNAREMILEEYSDARITVIDSMVNTVLQGIFVIQAANLRDSGADYEAAAARLEEIKGTGRIFFTVGNIEYLKHGGRIGKVAGVAGSVLGIRPIITLKQGEIFPSGIGRSRKSTTSKCIDLLLNYLKEQNSGFERFSIVVGFGYDYDEAVAFKDRALEILHDNGYAIDDIPIFQIGAAIGVHTGPYPLGFGIMEKSVLTS